jgi:tetratricopeptide (TPR) repeat protein
MDFGIAKSTGETRLTGVGATLGTIAYMSPEQTSGKEVDHRTDIWSLGVMLYQMLTGSLPFKGAYDQAIIYSILSEDPKPISAQRPDAPAWLGDIVGKALAKDRDRRYQSLDEFLADIEARRLSRRRQVSLRTVLLILAVIAVGITAATILFRRPAIVMERERIYLAVLPFENRTGEVGLDWMASGIPDNLTADLAQSGFFRMMSPERLHQVIREIGMDPAEVGTGEAIDLLGRATDLDAVAVGSFIKSGDEIRITMKIENPHDQEVIGSTIVDDTESRLLDLIDQLSTETRQIFNLSQEEIDEDLGKGAGLKRTRSLKAASDFGKGLEHSYAGAFLEASEAFGAAIEADPDFAMAYARASEAYKNLGYDDKAESLSLIAVDKVVEFTDRVPPADRTFILANHADLISSPDQAIESYRDFIEAYPDDPEGYYKLGLVYESISEWDLSAGNLEAALELDPKFGAARFELAKVLIRRNDLEPALAELKKLLAYYRHIGNREGEATVLNAIGIVHRHRNEFEEAIARFEVSIRIKEELGDKRGIAASLGNLGLIYRTIGRTDSALAILERSLELKREIGDKLGISTALNKIAQIYELQGRFDEALGYYERSYEIREDLGSKHLMANSLSDMAAVAYASTGEYAKAFEMDSTALIMRKAIGDHTGQIHSLGHIAAGLRSMGCFDEAAVFLREAFGIAEELADDRLLAYIRYETGRHCLARGKVDSAVAVYSEALEAYEELDVQPWIATVLASRGSAHRLKGEYTLALADLGRARDISENVGDRTNMVTALLGRSRLFCEIGYWVGCDSAIAELDSYTDRGLSYDHRLEIRLHKARLLHATNQLLEARELAKEIVADAKQPEAEIEGMLLLGEIALDQEDARGTPGEAARTVDALAGLAKAVEEARAGPYRRYEAEGLRILARTLSARGRFAEAIRSAEDALEIAERLAIDDYEYLITRGDALAAAGRSDEGLPFHIRALDRAATVLNDHCPAGLRASYLERKRIPYYVGLVEKVNLRSDDEAGLPDYKAIFKTN